MFTGAGKLTIVNISLTIHMYNSWRKLEKEETS